MNSKLEQRRATRAMLAARAPVLGAALAVGLALALPGCGGGGGGDAGLGSTPVVQDAAALNAQLRTLASWSTPMTVNTDARTLVAGDVVEGNLGYECTVTQAKATNEYTDILLAGLDSDALYPGALLQGKGVAQGQLNLLRLARSPITLTTTMNIDQPSITVARPDSASMREALATLIRRGDSRSGAIDVTPGTLDFESVQAYSFAQSLNAVKVSMAYAAKMGHLQTEFNFGSGKTANAHTVLVKLVQPLFKVHFSEDAITSPADLLAASVSDADLAAERAAGRLGDDNLPVYVKSVTYGRLMMYTLTSTEVKAYQELAAAVSASYKNFRGSGSYSNAQRQIIANSRATIVSFGGPQAAAVAATQELGEYFVPMEPTQAVPIAYELRDIHGQVAALGDITEYQQRDCSDYSWTVDLKQIDDSARVLVNGQLVGGDSNLSRTVQLDANTQPGLNTVQVVLWNNGLTRGSIDFGFKRNGRTVQGAGDWAVQSPICVGGCYYTWTITYNDTSGSSSLDGWP